uniref:Protein CDV3 homolog n=1 Tax=Glossina brevipalpis TaxID=37001 RepID=A0A1A9WQP5_9MUSC
MADLDDFFAKKDKKKSKKPKFLTAEELVKNLEESSKRELVKPKKLETITTANSASLSLNSGDGEDKIKNNEQNVEEEWKEFEEEQRKDYSGLKIGQLTLNDDEEQSVSDGGDDDGDNEGNINSELGTFSDGGPWKKVIPADEVTQIPMEMPKAPVQPYRVKALEASQKSKLRSKAAPDITNSDYFPSLGAARPEEQRKKKNEPAFEEVRHGGRVQRMIKEQPITPINASNRFQSLEETES